MPDLIRHPGIISRFRVEARNDKLKISNYNKNMKKIFYALIPFLLFFFSVVPSHAAYFASGENLTLLKEQKFNESVFVAAQTLTINADIKGDLFCAGQNIVINGNVSGDIICAGQSLKISGQVDGNVRAIGQQIEVSGIVARNVSVFSQTLTVPMSSNIKGDLLFGSQSIDVGGLVGRDLTGASQSITLTNSGKVGRNLEYYTEKTGTASIDEKLVKGKVTRHEVVTPEKDQFQNEIKKATPVLLVMKAILSILSSIILAFFLLYFTAHRTTSVTNLIKSSPVKSALVGLAVLITGPVAIIISCLTVIGIGLAAVIALFYALCLILASSYVAVRVGEMLVAYYPSLKRSVYLSTFLACLLIGLLVHIPVLGAIVGFLIFLIGLGSSFLSYLPSEK